MPKFTIQQKFIHLVLAAIDIGSNAARLLISEVIQTKNGGTSFNKLNLVRVPLRLGFDVFENNSISQEKINMFAECMKAYRHLMNAYKVEAHFACATSAMRDAQNAGEIIKFIEKECGIGIKVITGDFEANLVYENHFAENLDIDKSYLYIDVGGGSTELSYFSSNVLQYKQSFNIGTIRLLKNKVGDDEWDIFKTCIKQITKDQKEVVAIGSGGNINKVFSLSKRKEGRPLSIELLLDYYKDLSALSVTERIEKFNLREDRADVIVPALQIYTQAMRWANAKEIYVPKIGLADGLIKHLWNEVKNKNL